jgi:hypothetical protein
MFGGSFKWKKVDDGQITSRVESRVASLRGRISIREKRRRKGFSNRSLRADDEGVKTFEKS